MEASSNRVSIKQRVIFRLRVRVGKTVSRLGYISAGTLLLGKLLLSLLFRKDMCAVRSVAGLSSNVRRLPLFVRIRKQLEKIHLASVQGSGSSLAAMRTAFSSVHFVSRLIAVCVCFEGDSGSGIKTLA